MRSDSDCKNPELPSVKIIKILPRMSEDELFAQKKCYLGISIENPIFEGDSLKALLNWASERFEQCLVVVGDDLCRFNQRIVNGLAPDEALEAAHMQGDAFIAQAGGFIESISRGNVKLTRWNEHLQSDAYRQSRAAIDRLFATDAGFKAAIEKDAVSFARRQSQRVGKIAVEMDEAIELCCQYLLEEIAVFSALSERKWRVELYPGSELHALVDVARGKFADVPKPLADRINVELKVG
ncbi:MAG TPA: tRNA-dependent cyclodipeptide synthase [Phycisphaerales bacterium]|nr:tRNA-dependent cyclodipeptide synthase [Phycisphaerales bacterium]